LSRFVAIVPLTKDITPASASRQGNKSSRLMMMLSIKHR